MSAIKGKVGAIEIEWKAAPHGRVGKAQARVGGEWLELRWRRDAEGLWLELPDGVYGFDLQAEQTDDGRSVYVVRERDGEGEWGEQAFVREGQESAAAAGGAKKNVRVRAQMPGKIIRVQIAAGAHVEKGQPLLVMEAMKMENEIRAPQSGVVSALKVSEGQAVETGADLCLIDPAG